MKLLTGEEKAVVLKDFQEIWSVKFIRGALVAFPFCMVILLPAVFLAMIYIVPIVSFNGVWQLMDLMPEELAHFTIQQAMFYLMTNTVSPLFFLMVPLMSATMASANAFAGERERGTMETLFLTPISVRSLFQAKILGCIWVSLITTVISFVAFSIVTGVGNILLDGMPQYFNWFWLVTVAVLSPSLTVFGVLFMAMISVKSRNCLQSIQLSGYVLLPLILLFLGQFTGLYRLNALGMLVIGGFLIAADFALYFFTRRLFTAERIVKNS